MQFIVPLLCAAAFGVASYLYSVMKSNNALAANSEPLSDPSLEDIFQRMATALDVQKLRLNIYKIDAVNGLAAANSQIYITQGFINKYAAGDVTATELASVVAHELGHGVHQILAASQGELLSSTPLTLAETASVFGEMLTFRKLLDNATDPARRKHLLANNEADLRNRINDKVWIGSPISKRLTVEAR